MSTDAHESKTGKWAIDPEWAQNWGVPKLHPSKIGPLRAYLPMAPNGWVQVAPSQVGPCGAVAHCCSFGLERVSGDGEWVQRFPRGWGWAMGAMLAQRGDGRWLHCFPEVGDGLWLYCLAKVWIGKGAPRAVCIECRMVPSYMLVDKDGGWF